MSNCPHCSAAIPAKFLLSHSAMLGGSWPPLRCTVCNGISYRDRTGHGAIIAICLLVVAFLFSYPSIFSNHVWSSLSPLLVAIVRTVIWSFSVLSAYSIFSFVGSLVPIDSDANMRTLFNPRSYLLSWVFRAGMLWWMYVIYRELIKVS
jgi:hypothetical protein